MAIFHCQAKAISRAAGRSSTAASAYRAGVCLKDEITGEVHDYTRKQGVEHSEIVFPSGVNMSREELWNAAEKAEKRKDAKVAREWEIALPDELTPCQRRELAQEFSRHLAERYGVAVDMSIHEPGREGDKRNHHAHLLSTTRQIGPEGLREKTRILDSPRTSGAEVEAMRQAWADLANRALARAGHEARIDPRSLKAQGISREPTHHLGPTATAMERRGESTERGDLNRGKGEERAAAQTELIQAKKVQSGAERIMARARLWRVALEEARQQALNEKRAKQLERERAEKEEKEWQARLEAERKEQERQRREVEQIERGRSRGPSMGR